jgi:hypothetical protein
MKLVTVRRRTGVRTTADERMRWLAATLIVALLLVSVAGIRPTGHAIAQDDQDTVATPGSETQGADSVDDSTETVEPEPSEEAEPTETEPPATVTEAPTAEPAPTEEATSIESDPIDGNQVTAEATATVATAVDHDESPTPESAKIEDVEVVATSESEPASIAETATPEPSPEPATAPPTPSPEAVLRYTPAVAPTCSITPNAATEGVPAGGVIEYSCSYELDLAGKHLIPSAINVEWTIDASIGDGWTIQLLAPSKNRPSWTDPNVPVASASFQTAYRREVRDAGVEPSVPSRIAKLDTKGQTIDTLDDTAIVRFGVRVHRPRCAEAAVPIRLGLTGVASLPGSDDADTRINGSQPDPFFFEPDLAPIEVVAPVVTVQDFSLEPVAFSLDDQVTHGTVTILVENSIYQCQDWHVAVAVRAIVDGDVQDLFSLGQVGNPTDSTMSGVTVTASQSGRKLTNPIVVSVVHTGARIGTYTQTIGFNLTIPGQTSAGSYAARVIAAVDPVQR